MSIQEDFRNERKKQIELFSNNSDIKNYTQQWIQFAQLHRYSYNFDWLGRPIIQYPQDMAAMQEIVWKVKPDLIVETGIAHGGSLIMNASYLAMLDYAEAAEKSETLNPKKSNRKVLGIDIDIRDHNQKAIDNHPMRHMIEMIQGSSIDNGIIEQVKEFSKSYNTILVCLDSNHTHDHVLAELEAYAPLTSKGSYCIVFDTIVEDLPDEMFSDRPWGNGNNPKTAVWEYMNRLKKIPRKDREGADLQFEIDKVIENKLLITVAPDGYLKRI